MALSPDYPTEKPEHSVEITEPMTLISLDLRTGVATVTFAPGETIDVKLETPRLGGAGFGLCNELANHLAVGHKVWAKPETVNKQLAAAEGRSDGVPF